MMAPARENGRPRWITAVQVVLTVVVVGFAAHALSTYWQEFRAAAAAATLRWGWIAASGLLFLSAHLVLVQTWRQVLVAWDARIGLLDATHTFAVSSLARYVPGKLWQIGAMAMLARRAGVAPAAATGSAFISTGANIATGLLIVLVTGWPLAEAAYAGARATGIALLVALGVGLALTPVLLPRLVRVVARRTGVEYSLSRFPQRAIAHAVIGNVIAWVLYGVAFQLFSRGVVGPTPGSAHTYVAVYTLSYVFGYLMLFAPAGVGYREAAMVLVMPAAGLASVGEAGLVAVASRLWLTVLETLPGLCFLAFRRIEAERR